MMSLEEMRRELRTYFESLVEASRKLPMDPEVLGALREIGPPAPLHGPHYNYYDLVMHMWNSVALAGACKTNDLVWRDLPEIFKRRRLLYENIKESRLPIRDPEKTSIIYNHLANLWGGWQKIFEASLDNCFSRARLVIDP